MDPRSSARWTPFAPFAPLAALAVACGCLASACGGSGDASEGDKPSGERTEVAAPETPKDAPTGPFAAYDFAAAAQQWQGAWVIKDEAWLIEGDAITMSKKGEDTRLGFSVYSPCQVALTDADAGVTRYRPFAFAKDTLHVGLASAAGTLAGQQSIVCAMGRVYTLEGDSCLEWSEMFDDWKSQPGECAIEGEGDARRFVVGSSELREVEGAWLSGNVEKSAAVRHPDFASAKAALAAPAAPAPAAPPASPQEAP